MVVLNWSLHTQMTQNDQKMQNGPQAFFQTLKMVIDNHDHLVNSFEIWYLSRPQELKKLYSYTYQFSGLFWSLQPIFLLFILKLHKTWQKWKDISDIKSLKNKIYDTKAHPYYCSWVLVSSKSKNLDSEKSSENVKSEFKVQKDTLIKEKSKF